MLPFMITYYPASTLMSHIESIFPQNHHLLSLLMCLTTYLLYLLLHLLMILSPTIPHSELPPVIGSSRVRHPPSHLKDFVCDVSNQSSSPTNSTDFTSYPITDSLSYNKLSNQHLHFVLSLQTHTEPKSYAHASKFDCWNKAMETELTAIVQTGTYCYCTN